jgi:UDP-N-acetylglucosamine--N-acetylmuramyl-(pentapeptide) pyrophosphoryl-undecaprenol N-acetylglucosamine transferase
MSKKMIAIAAGGTAGHVFPAKALAKILGTTNDIIFFTDERGAKYLDKDIKKLKIKNIVGNIIKRGIALFQLGIATLKCIYLLKTRGVKLAIGFGGLTSFPLLFAAKILKIPIIIHEQNTVIGKANKFFVRDAELVAVSYNETIGLEKQDKVVYTGNPIRQEVFEVKRRRSRITKEIQILVIGGSQGSSIFDEVIPNAITNLPTEIQENITIYQQARDIDAVKKIYESSSVSKVNIETFFRDVPQLMADSDLIIARGGASTLSEIEHIGVPAIIIPMANSADNHQLYNAREFEKTGMGKAIEYPKSLNKILNDWLVKGEIEKINRDGKKNNAAQKLAVKVNDIIIKLGL